MVEPLKRSLCVVSYQLALFYGFFTVLLTYSTVTALEFSVEEYSSKTSQHYHRTRHPRGQHSSPYKSAASATTNTHSDQYESFSLNCPHVVDSSNENVRIEVTWTLNDTIWLKVEEGEKKIFSHLTTFNKRVIAGKTVLRVLLNNGRYLFDYDELTGDFAMEIRPVHINEDAGVWQCHVTVHQRENTHTLTSRSRVKVPHGHRSHSNRQPIITSRLTYDYLPVLQQNAEHESWDLKKSNKFTSFTRNQQEIIQISRDDTKRPQTIVFDRQSALAPQTRHAHASIDYEMSINQKDEEQYYAPRPRIRSAYFSNAPSRLHLPLITTSLLFLINR